jgi:hypothetical protein
VKFITVNLPYTFKFRVDELRSSVEDIHEVRVKLFIKFVEGEWGARGGIVVKALRYKPAGRRFDSRWCHWNFSVT